MPQKPETLTGPGSKDPGHFYYKSGASRPIEPGEGQLFPDEPDPNFLGEFPFEPDPKPESFPFHENILAWALANIYRSSATDLGLSPMPMTVWTPQQITRTLGNMSMWQPLRDLQGAAPAMENELAKNWIRAMMPRFGMQMPIVQGAHVAPSKGSSVIQPKAIKDYFSSRMSAAEAEKHFTPLYDALPNYTIVLNPNPKSMTQSMRGVAEPLAQKFIVSRANRAGKKLSSAAHKRLTKSLTDALVEKYEKWFQALQDQFGENTLDVLKGTLPE